ncbi:MAG: sulfite exporter TauE/SafE family protein [Leptolyngbya sp. IPPAS B-1204]|uniref:Probable membrane transporter protein n=2 Tax=Leptolyngbya sp. NK1-12 TaxID=2547451 RepID=A0AA96WJW2_9CYAN|nr:sulfite exporter TauE/SafE family protein [Leptolyngbya sp. NK1-12]
MVEFVDSGFSLVLLFGVALLGGVINGVAGGGGLIVFPTLLFTGMPAIEANATNTASLWVGTVASTVAYRKELISLRRELLLLTITSVTGGILGAQILLHTPQATFTALLPYLMLTATVVFAFGQPLIRWLRRHSSARSSTQTEYHLPLVLALLLQFGIAIYIGFFGGGAGIVILAILELMGLRNIHTMNAMKTWLAACTNGVAVITFIAAHAVLWWQATLMASAALIGGYSSARFAQRLHPIWVRSFVISVGCAITIYFFVH